MRGHQVSKETLLKMLAVEVAVNYYGPYGFQVAPYPLKMMKKAIFNWSGGKDSALALHRVLQEKAFDIGPLLTSVNAHYQRVSMHGVREALLEQQAASIGLPLHKLLLPEQPQMEKYNKLLKETMDGFYHQGFRHSIFGDIFLEDLRTYREERLKEQGFNAHFPLWKEDTHTLLREFLDLGFKTIVVCIKSEVLDESFAGRVIDEWFVADLPEGVDPCGENGEFHTFVYDGPIFDHPIDFMLGEKVYREYKAPQDPSSDPVCSTDKKMGFWFCDLIPKEE